MAHTIEDVNGELDPGPSINGLRELKEELAKQPADQYPVLKQLIEFGHTTSLMPLKLECRTLAEKVSNENVASTLTALSKSAGKAKEIVILAA